MAVPKGSSLSPENILTLIVDLKNIEACQDAARVLQGCIHAYHGEETADKVLAKARLSKQQMKENRNIRLLYEAQKILERGASIEQAAIEIARRNGNLPKNERLGPSGSEEPSAIRMQITRMMDAYAGTEKFLAAVQTFREVEALIAERKSSAD